jgi:hypothetical protein
MRSSAWCISCVLAIAISSYALAEGQPPARGAAGQGQERGQRGGRPDWHPLPPVPLEPGATQRDVTTALTAAPASLATHATVIKWKPDFSYDVLRKGLNRLVCYDLSGRPTHPPFETECTTVGNLPRVAQNLKLEANEQRQVMLEAAEDGTRAKPEFGSIWYHLMGPTRWGSHAHVTIAVPGATAQTLGLPDNGRGGGIWIMNAGTTTAHLMIPNEAPSALSGGGGAAGTPPLALEPGAVQVEVNRIVLAAPAALAAEATVIQWKPDFTYATLRKGKNGVVCYDLADRPGHPAFASECTTVGNMNRVAQTLKFEAMADGGRASLEAAQKDGTRVKPEFGSIMYDLLGQHRWDARLHVTIALPDATTRTIGLPEDSSLGGAWIMNAGTVDAHLMTPDDPPSFSMAR